MAKITAKGPDPTKAAPGVYKKLMENEVVRVFDVRFKPGQKADMHWHPNHVAYVVEGGLLEILPPKGESQKISSKSGDVVWMNSGHHEATNKGKSDIHVLVMELKGNTKKIS